MDIDVANRKISDVRIANMVVEFPRINDAFDALPTRFVYLPTLSDTLRLSRPPSAIFNAMMRVDTETGHVVRHGFGNRIAGEATFIPRGTSCGEAEGYLAVFAFDPVKETCEFVLRCDAPRRRSCCRGAAAPASRSAYTEIGSGRLERPVRAELDAPVMNSTGLDAIDKCLSH